MDAKDWLLLAAGFLLGFAANLLTWRIVEAVERRRQWMLYGRIGGTYTGYGQLADHVDYGRKSSDAKITYRHRNLLEIEVTEKATGNVWLGEIVMDGP